MNVFVIFDSSYTGPFSDAIWIIDSPDNRARFDSHATQIDQNSVVFDPANDPLTVFWSIFEHHPAWTEIIVKGLPVSPDIVSGVADEASVQIETEDGFRLKRIS
jgi:hypothetical protein